MRWLNVQCLIQDGQNSPIVSSPLYQWWGNGKIRASTQSDGQLLIPEGRRRSAFHQTRETTLDRKLAASQSTFYAQSLILSNTAFVLLT